jgi:hypothetical protein
MRHEQPGKVQVPWSRTFRARCSLGATTRVRRPVGMSPSTSWVTSTTAASQARRREVSAGFTQNTFTAMVEGVRERALALGLMDAEAWHQAIAELRRAAAPDGVFCYTFFKAVGEKRP